MINSTVLLPFTHNVAVFNHLTTLGIYYIYYALNVILYILLVFGYTLPTGTGAIKSRCCLRCSNRHNSLCLQSLQPLYLTNVWCLCVSAVFSLKNASVSLERIKVNSILLHDCSYANILSLRLWKLKLGPNLRLLQDRSVTYSEGRLRPFDVIWLTHLCHSLN